MLALRVILLLLSPRRVWDRYRWSVPWEPVNGFVQRPRVECAMRWAAQRRVPILASLSWGLWELAKP